MIYESTLHALLIPEQLA